MMKENNDIFLAGGDALVYLAEPMRKKCFTTFVWGHPFSTYVFYSQVFNPLLLHVPVTRKLVTRNS